MQALGGFRDFVQEAQSQRVLATGQMLAGITCVRSLSTFILFPGHICAPVTLTFLGLTTGPLHMLFLLHGILSPPPHFFALLPAFSS